MDWMQNDFDHPHMELKKLPELFFFAADDPKKPIKYDGEFEASDMQAWINKQIGREMPLGDEDENADMPGLAPGTEGGAGEGGEGEYDDPGEDDL